MHCLRTPLDYCARPDSRKCNVRLRPLHACREPTSLLTSPLYFADGAMCSLDKRGGWGGGSRKYAVLEHAKMVGKSHSGYLVSGRYVGNQLRRVQI